MKRSPWCLILTMLLLSALPAAAQELVAGKHYALQQADYPVANPPIPPVELLGPEKAKGAVIWNHGRSSAAQASEIVPAIGLYFALRGWDVYSLQRYWHSDDRAQATRIVMAGVDQVKAWGYRKVVLMGHSAGGFASLEAARYRDDIDTVIALAPAAFGDAGRSSSWRANDYELRPTIEALGGKSTKVALAYFTNDEYYEAQHPHVRGPWAKEVLTRAGLPHLVIDQPDFGDAVQGHRGGVEWEFAQRFGQCMLLLVESSVSPSCDEGDANTLKTFDIKFSRSVKDAASPLMGTWFGTWSDGRPAALQIYQVEPRIIRASYRTPQGITYDRDRDAPRRLIWDMEIDGRNLTIENSVTNIQLRLEDEKTLIGKSTTKVAGYSNRSIILRRVE